MSTAAIDRRRTPALWRALVFAAVSTSFVAMATFASGDDARAVTVGQLERAKATVHRLQVSIERNQRELEDLQQRAATIALAVSESQGELQVLTGRLIVLRGRVEAAEARLAAQVALLENRARAAYMGGSSSSMEFLLSSSSLGELNDRLVFVDQVAASDADVAAEIARLRAQLAADAAEIRRLQTHQARVVGQLTDRQIQLDAAFAQQQAIVDENIRKRQAARRTLSELEDRYWHWFAPYAGELASGPLKVCPVANPHAFGDDFGAPRYSGGYHAHEGNDIFAPEGTPIYAPFDGVAEDASNGLGGNGVIVRGEHGYAYNAHLSRFAKLGPVHAGDVIGFVGNTGNAVGTPPHDHFEFHPDPMPPSWPESAYGDSIVDDAINPYPLLQQVC